MPLDDDVDLQAIGTDSRCTGFSGADLAALVREAGILALEEIIKYEEDHNIKPIGAKGHGQGESSSSTGGTVRVKVEGGSAGGADSSGIKSGGKKAPSVVSQRHFEGALDRVTPSVSVNDHQQYLQMASSISGKRANMGTPKASKEITNGGGKEQNKGDSGGSGGGGSGGGGSGGSGGGGREESSGGGNNNGQPAKEPRAKMKAKTKTNSKSKRGEHDHSNGVSSHPTKKQRAGASE
jgi:hypothetical protein